MPTLTCPTCDRTFETELSTYLPFCSDRCRNIDLGRWLNEEYGVPSEQEDEVEID